MSNYNIPTDYYDLVLGNFTKHSMKYERAFTESQIGNPTGNNIFTRFMKSIESLFRSKEVKDDRISSSRGNIENFEGNENIVKSLSFIKDNFKGATIYNELNTIYEYLKGHADLYEMGYEKNIFPIIAEYDNAVYILVTGLSTVMSSEMDLDIKNNKLVVSKKDSNMIGIISNAVKGMASELAKPTHTDYLNELIKAADAPTNIQEDFVDTINAWNASGELFKNLVKGATTLVKKTINTGLGIIPLIRSIIYLRYKRKADLILELDQQVAYIEQNIELLRNKTNMDPKEKEIIIKKQQAYINAYRKKAEQLRAELAETEKDAAKAAKDDEPNIQASTDPSTGEINDNSDMGDDDGFSLESVEDKEEKETDDNEPSYKVYHHMKKLPREMEEADDNMNEKFVGKENNQFIDEDENDFLK